MYFYWKRTRVAEIVLMTRSVFLRVMTPSLPHLRGEIHLIVPLPTTALRRHRAVGLNLTVALRRASARRPWGTSAFWLSQSSFISLLWCFCFPLSPSGNNGVHGSVESANTPSIMTLCCTILFALTRHVMPAVVMSHAYIDNLFSQSLHQCLYTCSAANSWKKNPSFYWLWN